MKRIEGNSSRSVTFSKRRAGLVSKARHLSVLGDADVAVIVFSSRGKLSEFSTDRTNRLTERTNAEELSLRDMIELEQELDAALVQTRLRKTQLMIEDISTLQDTENKLIEEIQELEKQVAAGSAMENENGVASTKL